MRSLIFLLALCLCDAVAALPAKVPWSEIAMKLDGRSFAVLRETNRELRDGALPNAAIARLQVISRPVFALARKYMKRERMRELHLDDSKSVLDIFQHFKRMVRAVAALEQHVFTSPYLFGGICLRTGVADGVGFLDDVALLMSRVNTVTSQDPSYPLYTAEEDVDARFALLNQIYVQPLMAGDLLVNGYRVLHLGRALAQNDPGFAYELVSQEGRGPIFFEALLHGIFGNLPLEERLDRLTRMHSLIDRKCVFSRLQEPVSILSAYWKGSTFPNPLPVAHCQPRNGPITAHFFSNQHESFMTLEDYDFDRKQVPWLQPRPVRRCDFTNLLQRAHGQDEAIRQCALFDPNPLTLTKRALEHRRNGFATTCLRFYFQQIPEMLIGTILSAYLTIPIQPWICQADGTVLERFMHFVCDEQFLGHVAKSTLAGAVINMSFWGWLLLASAYMDRFEMILDILRRRRGEGD